MQKSDNRQIAASAHRKVQASTTLNRKYVRRPGKSPDIKVQIKKSSQISHFGSNTNMTTATQAKKEQPQIVAHPLQSSANKKMRERFMTSETTPVKKLTAKELKEQAIKKALASAAKPAEESNKKEEKLHFGFGRVLLAMSCAAVAVFAIVYFVNLNMPDLSLRVAAMQTGINASYPSYIPRDFNLSDITSEDGKITLNFKNNSTGDSFSLVEEASSWDSNALLTNYVKDAFEDNYTVIREQGLTIYISGKGDAAWVNGGIVYKLKIASGSLTKKQIKTIATSL